MIVEYVHPPIPMRSFDFLAYEDPEGIYGWGSTEAQALADFHEQDQTLTKH